MPSRTCSWRPVAAAADDVRAEPLLLQRLLVEPQRARRAHEHDDVALRPAGVDLGAQPGGDGAGLGAAPGLGGERAEAQLRLALLPAARLDGEQLDARLLRRVGREQPQLVGPRPATQRREAVAQHGRERGVDDVEDLGLRPEVDGEAADAGRRRARPAARGRCRRRRAGSRRSTGTRPRPRTGSRARAPRARRAGAGSCPGTRRP